MAKKKKQRELTYNETMLKKRMYYMRNPERLQALLENCDLSYVVATMTASVDELRDKPVTTPEMPIHELVLHCLDNVLNISINKFEREHGEPMPELLDRG